MNTSFDEELKQYYVDGALVRKRIFRGKVRYSAVLYRVLYDRDELGVVELFVVPGSCLRKDYLIPGALTPEEGHDTWCDIALVDLVDELGSAAIVDVVREGVQSDPDEVMRAMAAADALAG